jgi:sugar-specific transcriptional regulator TrmB
MDKEILKLAGLNDAEVEIYLTLLKLGRCSVGKISKVSNRHRTNIYDTLEKLKGKGLVSSWIEDRAKVFQASEPSRIIEFMKQNEKNVESIIAKLSKPSFDKQEAVKLEVLKGQKGIESILLEQIQLGKEVLGFGIDDEKYMKYAPLAMKRYLERLKEKKINERLITRHGVKTLVGGKQSEYRFIDPQYFNPTATVIYGDRVAIIVWEPVPIVIKMVSMQLSDAYRKSFELLWKIAKKK